LLRPHPLKSQDRETDWGRGTQWSVLLDRIEATNGVLTFRVADFRIKIPTWFFILPIKLSSGQLQQALFHGC
jgi:hypothetical protein